MEKWCAAAQHCREVPDDLRRNFKYPPLRCFAENVEESAEADETCNWYSIPKTKWPKWQHLCTFIRDGYGSPRCLNHIVLNKINTNGRINTMFEKKVLDT